MNKSHFCADHERRCDTFTIDQPERASCAALLGTALAPWEGLTAVAFASEALRQLAADLCILGEVFSDANEREGPPSNEMMRRFVAGIEGRARVASEVVRRLDRADMAFQGGAR